MQGEQSIPDRIRCLALLDGIRQLHRTPIYLSGLIEKRLRSSLVTHRTA
jgi:hypothetical protein